MSRSKRGKVPFFLIFVRALARVSTYNPTVIVLTMCSLIIPFLKNKLKNIENGCIIITD